MIKTVCVAEPESQLAQVGVGVGVRWGLAGREFEDDSTQKINPALNEVGRKAGINADASKTLTVARWESSNAMGSFGTAQSKRL